MKLDLKIKSMEDTLSDAAIGYVYFFYHLVTDSHRGQDRAMSDPGYLLSIYLHLAAASQRRRRPHVRDRLLLIAGSIASRMNLEPVAAQCRRLVLQHNPKHLIHAGPRWQWPWRTTSSSVS